MKYLTIIWFILRNLKQIKIIYEEGYDIYEIIKQARSDKKITKKEYEAILDEIIEFFEALKLRR